MIILEDGMDIPSGGQCICSDSKAIPSREMNSPSDDLITIR